MPPLNPFQKKCLTLAIGQSLLSPSLVDAASISVNTTSDAISAQNCTLREAIAITNSGNPNIETNGCDVAGALGNNDQINFDLPGSNTIQLSRGQLEITSSVSVNGPGAELLVIDANQQSRVMSVNGAGANGTTIDGLSLMGGVITYAEPFSTRAGAGLDVRNTSSLTLSNSVVSNNQAAIFIDGVGISFNSAPNATLSNVVVSNNVGVYYAYGGGISVSRSNNTRLDSVTVTDNKATQGAGLNASQSDDLVIVDSVFENNDADADGDSGGQATGGGLIISSSDNVQIANTTVSNNTALRRGGGLYTFRSNEFTITQTTISGNHGSIGAGVYTSNGTLSISNSTISGNRANQFVEEYGGYNYFYAARGAGIYSQNGAVSINNVTIADNQALDANAQAGGIYRYPSNSVMSLVNTVVANNIGGDCNINIIDTAANWFSDTSCNGSADGKPQLGDLSDNGGDTLTQAPLAGSGLLDAGDASACQIQANGVDQLDQPRGESACTIGAVENIGQPDETIFVIPLENGKQVIFSL